jgi:8-hydroxy-5-deazaflavin:NADPH oxidoreductase
MEDRMKIGVLGTGMVGNTIGSKLVALGHDVTMGSRDAKNPKAIVWARSTGVRAQAGTFADAAVFSEVLFNCTHGANSIDAMRAAGEKSLAGKIVIDVANVLPPDAQGPEALGEQIQKAFPHVRVVKALNTVNCEVMVDASKISEVHTIFMCGNDDDAKKTVRGLLEAFGWKDIIDLGDITNARATEQYLPLWLPECKALGTLNFNIKVVR